MASLVGTALMQSDSANADTVVDNNHVQVVSGDTLSKIAQEHGTTVSQLAQDNNISNVDLIHVGDVIAVVPGSEPASQQNTTSVENTAPVAPQTANVATNQQQAFSNSYNNNTNYAPVASGSEADAKAWIANRESGGSYTAQNGKYTGKYQLDASYLNGDYSPANQEQVADQYVAQRYGSWSNAKQHWLNNGWY